MTTGAPPLDETHDPARRSFVASANDGATDFPVQNLPYCVFTRPGDGAARHVGAAIGDQILDLTVLEAEGLFPGADPPLFAANTLNPLMAAGPATWQARRAAIASLLSEGASALQQSAVAATALVAQDAVRLHRPFEVAGYTDFYSSREHATNVGAMFRGPADALSPNWLHMPIAYNGRASTVVVSGTPVRRPMGQLKPPDSDTPVLGPSARLDIEIELGTVVGTPSAMGHRLDAEAAGAHIFGYVLLNDWSARDIQLWEYRPLGPFQSKAFATTISPFVVTAAALAPYRVPPPPRQFPLLPYLSEAGDTNLDIHLEAALAPSGSTAQTISRTNARHLYYSPAQQLAHHTLCGCAMETGDLLGSGTISGPSPDSLGSLLELTRGGQSPLSLRGGPRSFLEDGDTVTLSGWCEGRGHRIGFGTASGTILPAEG